MRIVADIFCYDGDFDPDPPIPKNQHKNYRICVDLMILKSNKHILSNGDLPWYKVNK